MTPILIHEQQFHGWESLQDWDRDMSEAIQSDYNPRASVLNGEFEGTIVVSITYLPAK